MTSTVDIGPLVSLYPVDRSKLFRGRVIAIVGTVVLVGVFLAVAILGPGQQVRMNNAENALLCGIMGWVFVIGFLGLGGFALWRIARERRNSVSIHEAGLEVTGRGGTRAVRWSDVMNITKTLTGNPMVMWGILGMFMAEMISPGDKEIVVLGLADRTQLNLPALIANREKLLAEIRQRTGILDR